MRKESALPVRLDSDEKRRLKEIAERMGVTVSALIRLLVRSFVEEYERQGGRVALPPDWRELFDQAEAACSRQVAEKPTVSYALTRAKPATQESSPRSSRRTRRGE